MTVLSDITAGLLRARERHAEEFPLIVFPTKSGEPWLLLDEEFEEICAAVPALPIVLIWLKIQKAHGWVSAFKGRRKTAKGMRRFLVTWVTR
jgi:hypothetical protein